MGQIDYFLGYADLATALADPLAAAARNSGNTDWLRDQVTEVTITRISTGVPLAGFFILVSLPRVVNALLVDAALKLAIDRDAMNARKPAAVLARNVTLAVLNDIIVQPVFEGSSFPWGSLS